MNISFPCASDCVLYAVGKPVYNKFTDQVYGSWLKDASPKNDDAGEKIWSTNESDIMSLYEYENKAAYRNNVSKKFALKPPGFTVGFASPYDAIIFSI